MNKDNSVSQFRDVMNSRLDDNSLQFLAAKNSFNNLQVDETHIRYKIRRKSVPLVSVSFTFSQNNIWLLTTFSIRLF